MGAHDDGQPRAATPEMLVGIGNAGKRIVTEFMRTDWILREAIEPRGDTLAPDVQAYVVDTDRDQQSTDERVAAQINEHIEALADEVGRDEPVLDTGIEYINPLDGVGPELQQPSALAQPAVVNEFAGDLRAWWMDDSDEMLVDDYNEGLLRRRALGKAIYHASTGSGMFLDVAREIAGNVDTLHLFAVIPDTGERDKKLANAYAALSELEYLSRHEISPFKNVVLLPFGGLEDIRDESDRQEFDEAAVNAIMAHRNIGSCTDELGTMAGPPEYAPFTVAVPQTLRYDVEDLAEADGKIRDFLDDRLHALEAEHELYDALEDYVVTHFRREDTAEYLERANEGTAPDSDRFSLTSAQAAALRDRFDTLVEVLDGDVLDALGYDPAWDWLETLEDAVDTLKRSTEEGVERNEAIVTEVPRVVRQVDDPEDRYPQERRHQHLDEFVQRELEAIRRRANLLRAVSLFEDDDIAAAIEGCAMDDDRSVAPVGVEDERAHIRHRLDDLEDDIDRIEAFESDIVEMATRARDEWLLDVRPTLDEIETIDRHEDAIVDLLDDLEAEIRHSAAEVEGTAHPEGLRDITLDFDRFDELNERLDEVGLSPIDSAAIERSVDALGRAKAAKVAADREGILRWLPFGGNDWRAEFADAVRLIDDDLFSVQTDFDEQFYAKYTGDLGERAGFLGDFDAHRSTLVAEAVDSFERRLADPSIDRETFDDEVGDALHSRHPYLSWPGSVADAPQALRDRLEAGFDDESVDTFLDAIEASGVAPDESDPVNAGFRGAFVDPVADLRTDIERERDRLLVEHGRYEALMDIIQDEGHLFSTAPTTQRPPDIEFVSVAENDQYINRIDVGRDVPILEHDSLVEAGLHEEDEGVIGARLKGFAENIAVLDDRLPLYQGRPAPDIGTIPDDDTLQNILYDHHKILPVFMGEAFAEKDITDYDPDGDIEATLRRTIAAQNGVNGYLPRTCEFGGPWDTSLVTFVGGVFLDNLRPVREASGYREKYFEQRDELVESIKARHAHGLDGMDRTMVDEDGTGAYVYRDPLIDLRDPDELLEFVDATEADRDDVFASKTNVETFESTIDLGE
ncbi:hypothetical protein [Haloplanus salilacus]|uniref:hypothetical protein n=1 Tax=Haloplanus salilacus TaxID=2949994 RepID=UPI0030CC3AB2